MVLDKVKISGFEILKNDNNKKKSRIASPDRNYIYNLKTM